MAKERLGLPHRHIRYLRLALWLMLRACNGHCTTRRYSGFVARRSVYGHHTFGDGCGGATVDFRICSVESKGFTEGKYCSVEDVSQTKEY